MLSLKSRGPTALKIPRCCPCWTWSREPRRRRRRTGRSIPSSSGCCGSSDLRGRRWASHCWCPSTCWKCRRPSQIWRMDGMGCDGVDFWAERVEIGVLLFENEKTRKKLHGWCRILVPKFILPLFEYCSHRFWRFETTIYKPRSQDLKWHAWGQQSLEDRLSWTMSRWWFQIYSVSTSEPSNILVAKSTKLLGYSPSDPSEIGKAMDILRLYRTQDPVAKHQSSLWRGLGCWATICSWCPLILSQNFAGRTSEKLTWTSNTAQFPKTQCTSKWG